MWKTKKKNVSEPYNVWINYGPLIIKQLLLNPLLWWEFDPAFINLAFYFFCLHFTAHSIQKQVNNGKDYTDIHSKEFCKLSLFQTTLNLWVFIVTWDEMVNMFNFFV